MEEKQNWHNLDFKEAARILETDIENGLSEKEIKKRQEKFGRNLISKERKASSFKIFLRQFKSPLIYILLVAGVITLFLKKYSDSLVIFLAISINAVFGFWEEKKTSNILEKLKKVLKTKAVVLRNGQRVTVWEQDLVPGDIIFLKAGDRVPADARLVQAENLKISEAILTGEWISTQKKTIPLPKETPLADRDNMVYMGTLVEKGKGIAIVTETGRGTEAGKISRLVEETKEEKTPLQKKLGGLGRFIGFLIGSFCFFIFFGGILRMGDVLEMFEASIAIAVGGIPEALPVVMVVILAIGMERILRKKGLVRNLSSVETLGSAQIICFDKTRTLTQGKMALEDVLSSDNQLALKIAVLCSDGFIENFKQSTKRWKINGDATDKAILEAGIKNGLVKNELEDDFPEIAKAPFDPANKYLLSLRKDKGKFFLYISGAPEKILERSKNKNGWQKKINQLAGKGLRVVGVGYRELKKEDIKNEREINLNRLAFDFNFVGLIALKDPLRPGIKRAVSLCRSAGIRPILVTGDHKLTAIAVAREIGIKAKGQEILEGRELEAVSDQELDELLEKIKIYARVEPSHKMRIVSAWQRRGKVVAMTGDGVNDAPALKKADIGVALGSGTEVAKESADLVLLNDSFSIVVKAIEEGRVVLDNIRKSIAYILADSFASVILVGFSTIIMGWPLPILPVQILWNNFVEDTLPNIAYAFEPKERGIMKRRPSSPTSPLLTKEMKVLIFGTGIIDQLFLVFLFWFLWGHLGFDLDYVRTMVFGALCIDTAFVVFSYKSFQKNVWQMNPFSNKWLNVSALLVFVFLFFALYCPPVQKILHTVPLGAKSWFLLLGIGFMSAFLVEITKWFFINRKQKYEKEQRP